MVSTVCVFRFLQQISPGVLKRSGKYEILVEPCSAIQLGSASFDQVPIDKDHSSIVKFGEDDINYRSVLFALTDVQQKILNAGA